MKLFQQKSFWILTSVILSLGYWASCTKHDQIIVAGSAISTSTTLTSIKITTPPTIDGTIDASWDKATKLSVLPTVPDPGNGLFSGYSGQQYPATVRSMYDNQNIYFLVEVQDATQSVNVSPWYFDPTANVPGKTGWAKEPNSDTYDANGVLTRAGMGEDRVAMLWNIDNSTPKLLHKPVMQVVTSLRLTRIIPKPLR